MKLLLVAMFISIPLSLLANDEEKITYEVIDELPAKIYESVTENLKDPFSVKFRNLKISSAGIHCGEINAKNSYGAYSGFEGFFATGDIATIANTQLTKKLYEVWCEDKSIE